MKPNTPPRTLREQITAHLERTTEATAKQIAEKTTERDFPSRVLNELNRMRTDALVECEKRKGKGNEYYYWLVANAPTNAAQNGIQPQPAVGKNTGSDGSAALPCSAGAVAVPKPAPKPAASPSAAPVAEDVMPPADPALLAMANRMLCERLEGVAHVLRGCGLPALAKVTGNEDLQPAAAALSGAYQMACAERDELVRQHDALRARHDQYDHAVGAIHITCRDAGIPAGLVHERVAALADELRNARALADKLQHLLDSKTHECEALRTNSPTEHPAGEAYLDDIHAALAPFSGDLDASDLSELELARRAAATLTQPAEEAVDVLDAAKGYLVRINKHIPRITITPKSAVAHAKSAARRGKRAKVYALVPVGEAVPGAEWSDAA